MSNSQESNTNEEEYEDFGAVAAADDVTPDKNAGVLYLGIDLGTSRTSVSSSNGVRDTVASYVGYPKDAVSRKLLKKDVLFGSEAIENRLALDFYRPLEHGVLKCSDKDDATYGRNLQAAQDLIAEIIRRARPRKDELIYSVIGVPSQASINNKQAILDAAREVVDSVMLCSEPFTVAYGLDMLDVVLVIDIGAGPTDLCRVHGTMPEDADQVTLTYAGDWIDNRFSELL
jgi:rod shape-determining protein MreB